MALKQGFKMGQKFRPPIAMPVESAERGFQRAMSSIWITIYVTAMSIAG